MAFHRVRKRQRHETVRKRERKFIRSGDWRRWGRCGRRGGGRGARPIGRSHYIAKLLHALSEHFPLFGLFPFNRKWCPDNCQTQKEIAGLSPGSVRREVRLILACQRVELLLVGVLAGLRANVSERESSAGGN